MTIADSLDRIDFAIVSELQHNARLSNKQLAARIGLAESSTLIRVRNLESRGVIKGYHADIEPAAVNISLQAFVAVKLVRHSRDIVERFQKHCQATPHVIAAYNIGGNEDFLVHVGVADSNALRELILNHISTRPEVAHIETHLIFDMVRGSAVLGSDTKPTKP